MSPHGRSGLTRVTALTASLPLTVLAILAAHPAEGRGMVVGPPRIEMDLAPGESREQVVTVTNTDPLVLKFRVSVVPFAISETGRLSFEASTSQPIPPRSFIQVSPEEIDLRGDAAGIVRVRVTAPATAAGTIWGGVLVTIPTEAHATKGIGVVTEPQVLVPVYVTVRGTEKRAAEVTSFEAVRDARGKLHFRATLRNSGNTLLRPAGTWLLEQMTPSGPVELVVVPFSGDPVFPGETRKFEGEATGKLPAGDLTASVFFDYGVTKGAVASGSGPVRSAESGPATETRSVAAGTIPEASRLAPRISAAVPVRLSLAKSGIRLNAGRPISYRTQTVPDPPALVLDLVGYRVVNPGPLEGRRFVRRLEVREIEKKPLVTRVTVSFRLPVDARVQEGRDGLFIALSPSLPAPASGSGAALAAAAPSAPAPRPTAALAAAAPSAPAPRPTAALAAAAPPAPTPRPTAALAAAAPPAPASSAVPPPAAPALLQGGYVVQVGAFAVAANAETAKKVVRGMGYSVSEQTIQRDGRDLLVVMAGPFAERAAAIAASRKLGGLVRTAAPKR